MPFLDYFNAILASFGFIGSPLYNVFLIDVDVFWFNLVIKTV